MICYEWFDNKLNIHIKLKLLIQSSLFLLNKQGGVKIKLLRYSTNKYGRKMKSML